MLNWYEAKFGRPWQVIAAGNSMGGLVSVLLAERHPRRFSGVLASGRARLALANALAGIPGWYRAALPPPAAVGGQITQQAQFDQNVMEPLAGPTGRAILEAEAGANPSSNTGVNYRDQLARSGELRLVENAYRQAGLSLDADLRRLIAAPPRGGHCSFTASEEVVTLRGLQTRLNTGRGRP